jgi:large repetitive protein
MPQSLRSFLKLGGLGLLGAMASCSEDVVAPSLSATCAATPGSGRAPLTVNFSLSVDGAQGAMSVQINYGDGAAGSEISAPHTYANAGSYTTTFNVSTPTQSALCSAVVRADAAPTPAPTPTPVATNHQPVAVFNTTPDADASDTFRSRPPLTVTFNVCRSSDTDGDDLNYRLDLDGDGVFEVDGPTGSDCRRTHTYTKVGVFVARVCVTDLLLNLSPAHPYQCRKYVVRIE